MIVIISHPEKSSVFPIETKEHSINRDPKLGKSIIREQVAYKEGLKVDCKKLLKIQNYAGSSRENSCWTLLILSWYKNKQIFNRRG